jgi:hypothetical protein
LARGGRDSGAILVAATRVNVPNAPESTCGVGATNQLQAALFSNFGTRIDASSWGWCVVTTGGPNPNLFHPNGDDRQAYTQSFNGTSSATPIVASAGMAYQGWQKMRTSRTYSSRIVRAIVQNFGTATTGAAFIGKQPNVGTTLAWLASDDDGDGVLNGDELSAGRLANISTRAHVGTGNDVMIAGFVVQGPVSKTVAIVGTGPSLANFGIQNPLANPTLQIVDQQTLQLVASNDDWQSGPNAGQLSALQNPSITVVRSSDQAVMASNDDWRVPQANETAMLASPFYPSVNAEAALITTLNPGLYTVVVSPSTGSPGNGVAVVGVYAY